ncbi:MAG: HNH endonuclease [Promethearchaeota archaeon]
MIFNSEKSGFCIFCGKTINENNYSTEHIIPKSILKSDCLTIDSVCKNCNHLIGKKVEQPAIRYLKKKIGRLILDNQNIRFGRRRRRNRRIKIQEGGSFLPYEGKKKLVPTSIWINTENKRLEFVLDPHRAKLFNFDSKDISEKSETFTTWFPYNSNEGLTQLQLLGNKIIFELCYWLWEDSFLKTEDAKIMKEWILRGVIEEDITSVLKEDEPVVYEVPDDFKETGEEPAVKISPFDNTPHITFAVLSFPNGQWFALLNLFGIEITTNLFSLPSNIVEELKKNKGIVLIIRTTAHKGHSKVF